ncbi:MAG: hypothetical protein CV087_07485 [Candidatus Brocadia sp. WS118]|nr:MAG: hypothetical protein CV087_07485 [Candidatus Brocadia sp. WS118]
MKNFELNGKTYETDEKTLEILEILIPRAKQTGDNSAVIAVLTLGEMAGKITEIKTKKGCEE